MYIITENEIYGFDEMSCLWFTDYLTGSYPGMFRKIESGRQQSTFVNRVLSRNVRLENGSLQGASLENLCNITITRLNNT